MSPSAARPVVLIGAGRMGGALARGWLAAGLGPALAVADPAANPELAAAIEAAGGRVSADVAGLGALKPSALVLAVKPQMLDGVLADTAPLAAASSLVVSIAAGASIGRLSRGLGTPAIVRAMPNTPAAIGRGISVAVAPGVDQERRELAETLLASGGAVVWIEDEALMDAVTALSGSGPAYVFLLVEALAGAGAAAGLSDGLAMQLARATLSGAAALLDHGRDTPQALREAVTSPGGTTAAALEVLERDQALRRLLRDAVAAAAARSRALGS